MRLFKRMLIFSAAVGLAVLLAIPFGSLYLSYYKIPIGFSGFYEPGYVRNFGNGIFISYIFAVIFLFTTFEGLKGWLKYLLVLPVVVLMVFVDYNHSVLGLVGFIIALFLGYLVNLVLLRFNK